MTQYHVDLLICPPPGVPHSTTPCRVGVPGDQRLFLTTLDTVVGTGRNQANWRERTQPSAMPRYHVAQRNAYHGCSETGLPRLRHGERGSGPRGLRGRVTLARLQHEEHSAWRATGPDRTVGIANTAVLGAVAGRLEAAWNIIPAFCGLSSCSGR